MRPGVLIATVTAATLGGLTAAVGVLLIVVQGMRHAREVE
jgi:hypothetical protein